MFHMKALRPVPFLSFLDLTPSVRLCRERVADDCADTMFYVTICLHCILLEKC